MFFDISGMANWVKKLMLGHWEIVCLAIGGIVTSGYLVFGVLLAQGNPDLENLKKDISEIEEKMKGSNCLSPLNIVDYVKKNKDNYTLGEVISGNDWIFHRLPDIKIVEGRDVDKEIKNLVTDAKKLIEEKRYKEAKEKLLEAKKLLTNISPLELKKRIDDLIVNVNANLEKKILAKCFLKEPTIEDGRITLHWEKKPVSKGEKEDKIQSFVVQKKSAYDSFKNIAAVKVYDDKINDYTYPDSDIKPDNIYQYKILAEAESGKEESAKTEMGEEYIEVFSPRAIRLSLIYGTQNDARIKIATNGVEKSILVKKGEAIGETGWLLKEVGEIEITRDVWQCQVQVGKEHKPVKKKEKGKAERAIIINGEGKEEILWLGDRPPSRVEYKLCNKHWNNITVLKIDINRKKATIEIRKFFPEKGDTFTKTFDVEEGEEFGGSQSLEGWVADFGIYKLVRVGKIVGSANYYKCPDEYLNEEDPSKIKPHTPKLVEGKAEGEGVIYATADGKEYTIWTKKPVIKDEYCILHRKK